MAPYMLPTSVSPTPLMPNALALPGRSDSFTALVRNEYCE
jgi:hypothetical protein